MVEEKVEEEDEAISVCVWGVTASASETARTEGIVTRPQTNFVAVGSGVALAVCLCVCLGICLCVPVCVWLG